MLRLCAGAFPFTVDAKEGIGKPNGVVRLDHDVVGRIQTLAVIAVCQDRDLAVLFGAGYATSDGVLACQQTTLAITDIAVGIVGVFAEDGCFPCLLIEFHDAVVRNVAEQQVPTFWEISRAFGPPETGCHLFQRAAVDAVFGETGVQNLNYRVRVARVGRECHGLCKGIAAQYSSTCTNGSLHEATAAGNGLLVHVVSF